MQSVQPLANVFHVFLFTLVGGCQQMLLRDGNPAARSDRFSQNASERTAAAITGDCSHASFRTDEAGGASFSALKAVWHCLRWMVSFTACSIAGVTASAQRVALPFSLRVMRPAIRIKAGDVAVFSTSVVLYPL